MSVLIFCIYCLIIPFFYIYFEWIGITAEGSEKEKKKLLLERKLGFRWEVQQLISHLFPTKVSSGGESFHSEEVNERYCGFPWD